MAASTTRKPSAAEVARREAQSAEDTGKKLTVEVDLFGVKVKIDPDVVRKPRFLAYSMRMSDEQYDDGEKMSAMMHVLEMLLGDNYFPVLDAAGDVENLGTVMEEIMNAVNPS